MSLHAPRRRGLRLLTIVFIASLSFAAPSANAAERIGLEARASVGFGSMLSQWQRDQGYTSGFVPDLRPGLRLDRSIAAELVFQSWFFPRVNAGVGRASLFGAGARWDPRLLPWLTWFVDGHAGLALTGPLNRFMFDAGTGADVWVAEKIALGPYVRYGHVVSGGADPRFWAIGLGATISWAPGEDELSAAERKERQRLWERDREKERRDRDGDGVPDGDDNCPDDPAGSRRDPSSPGCPRQERRPAKRVEAGPAAGDRDGDGVADREDQCPDRPFGKYADPLALGCPLPDQDRDGIPDVFDACPKKRGQPSPRERLNGCAAGATPPRASSTGREPSA